MNRNMLQNMIKNIQTKLSYVYKGALLTIPIAYGSMSCWNELKAFDNMNQQVRRTNEYIEKLKSRNHDLEKLEAGVFAFATGYFGALLLTAIIGPFIIPGATVNLVYYLNEKRKQN